MVRRLATAEQLEALRLNVVRSRPFARADWVELIARRLSLESTLRRAGRRPKEGQV